LRRSWMAQHEVILLPLYRTIIKGDGGVLAGAF
jgi:hypothetical protein